MNSEQAHVYILANTFHRLYTGVTSELEARIHDHKIKANPKSFTARYNIGKLVHFEAFQSIQSAINREKQIKGWLRVKKIALIVAHNPTWRDLSLDWGQPTEPFDENSMHPPVTFNTKA